MIPTSFIIGMLMIGIVFLGMLFTAIIIFLRRGTDKPISTPKIIKSPGKEFRKALFVFSITIFLSVWMIVALRLVAD